MMDWNSMTVQQRNDAVGDIIGAEKLTAWYLYVGPHCICQLTFHKPEDKAEVEAYAALCNKPSGWKVLAESQNLAWKKRPEGMEVKARMHQWHIRYSDTPGGGWEVVQWLAKKGYVSIHNSPEQGREQWTVQLNLACPLSVNISTFVAVALTMDHAACLVAIQVAEVEKERGAV